MTPHRVSLPVVFVFMLLAPSLAQAGEPCGGVLLQDGLVKTGAPIAATLLAQPADLACAQAVGAALKARSGLRSVTVAVRVPESQRLDGTGLKVAVGWQKILEAAGIPGPRISTLVPALMQGQKPLVTIAYREPKGRRPVALVQAMTGSVKVGPDALELTDARQGDKLAARDFVRTGPASAARLALADGSFVSLLADSQIRLSQVQLNKELKREVHIDLQRGKVEALADYKGPGSRFDIATATAIAGVRGTHFRVGLRADNKTAVETLKGTVELAAPKTRKAVMVVAGNAAVVDAKGEPSPPRALLGPAEILGPLAGTLSVGTVLEWVSVGGAKTYRLEVGKDAEFVSEVHVYRLQDHEWAIPPNLPAGQWFWRVLALDDEGFVGLPSKVHGFVRGR